jgi:hypothetical protein
MLACKNRKNKNIRTKSTTFFKNHLVNYWFLQLRLEKVVFPLIVAWVRNSRPSNIRVRHTWVFPLGDSCICVSRMYYVTAVRVPPNGKYQLTMINVEDSAVIMDSFLPPFWKRSQCFILEVFVSRAPEQTDNGQWIYWFDLFFLFLCLFWETLKKSMYVLVLARKCRWPAWSWIHPSCSPLVMIDKK